MYTLKMRIADQTRIYPCQRYYYGYGTLVEDKVGFGIKYHDYNEKDVEKIRHVTNFLASYDTMVALLDKRVFYILLFGDAPETLVAPTDFSESTTIYVTQEGKTVDKI